jgi:hypothetical protein
MTAKDTCFVLNRLFFFGFITLALAVLSADLSGQSTVTDVGTRNIIKLLADPVRPLVYGLNQGSTGVNSTVVAFDAATGLILNEVTIGSSPTDFDLSARTDALYVIHLISRITRINLQTFAVDGTRDLPTIPAYSEGLHFDIATGRPGIVYYTDAFWAPSVHIYDFEKDQELSVYNPPGESTPEGEGVGDLAVSKNGSTLYTWRQYGWTAGVISTYVRKADSSGTQPVPQDVSNNYPEREPFDTPILLDSAEQRVFYKTRVHDANDLKRVLTTFPEHIYAITQHGELAFGTSKVFNGLTGAQLGTLPFPTTISAVSGDQKRLFVYSTSTRKLVTTPISQYGEVSGPGLVPAPREGEAVSAGLDELFWSSSPVAIRYEVYLGTDTNQLATATTNSLFYVGSTGETSIRLKAPIQEQGVYYWRVDVVSINGTTTGVIWSFQVAPIVVIPKKVRLVAIAGSQPLPVPINVHTNGSGSSWTVVEDIPWASVSPATGTGDAVVAISIDVAELPTGSYTNSLSFTSGVYSFSVPVELQVIPLEITKMVADLERPYIYALQGRSGGTSLSSVLFINTETGRIEKTLPIGSNLVDVDINYAEGRLYLADWGTDVTHVVDLKTQLALEPLHLGTDVYKINSRRPGRIITEGLDQWINVNIVDSLTGTLVKAAWLREGDGEIDPKGEFYYHCDNNISNAHITKYRISDDSFEQLKASLEHPYGSRNLLLSPDGSRLFWRGYVYDADLNELGSLQEEIHATTLHGELAFSESKVFNTANGRVLTNLPFSSTIMAISGDQRLLFAFTNNKRLEVFRVTDIAPVFGGELVPSPRSGEVVSLPVPELAWSISPFALRYKVFFGTSEAAVAAANDSSPEFLGTTDKTNLLLSATLAAGRSYFWRVDAVGFSGTRQGRTWNFITSPLIVAPKSLSIQTVAGAPAPTRAIQITGSNVPWSVSANASWFSVSPVSGIGSGAVNVAIATNLPVGTYTNTLIITAGESVLEVPVVLQVFKMSLSKMLADRERPYIYGLHPGSGTFDDAFLIFINTTTEQIENVLPIGANPTDFTINYFEDRLYVSNWLRNKTRVIDLIRQVELPALELGADVYKINGGRSGRIYVEQQDQWINISIVDSLTGTQVATGFVREGDGEIDPQGEFYYHSDNNISNAHITKYRITSDSFEQVATSVEHAYGSRNLLLSPDGSRLFWQGYMYDSNLRELGSFGEEIYAVTQNGEFALSSSKVYDTATRQANFSLPFSTTVMAVAGTQNKVFLYNGDGSIRVLEMREIVNRPPVALNMVVQTDEDTPVAITPSGSDPDLDPLTFELVFPPSFGQLSATTNGWIFTPATNFVGSVAFNYIAKDPWRSSLQASVTINILAVNDPPLVEDTTVTAVKGVARTIQLNGSDSDGDVLLYEILTQPQHGSLSGTPPTLRYRPADGYSGQDQFRYSVSDGKSAPATATVNVVVQEPVCREVPEGIVGWWTGEDWLENSVGGVRLLPTNWTNFAAGIVGRGFQLSTNAPELRVPGDSRLWSEPGFTIEAWLNPEALTNAATIFEWEESGPRVYAVDGKLGVMMALTSQVVDIQTAATLVPGVFQHIALTFERDAGRFRLYLNGRTIADYMDATFPAQASGTLHFGAPLDTLSGQRGFTGILDEISTYARPLSEGEIEEIFLASSKGKCPLQVPPSFSEAASSREIPAGGNIELAPALRGSPPMSLQWFLNGVPLSGATNATLVVSNNASFVAGIYMLRASNAFGGSSSRGEYLSARAASSLVNRGFESGSTSGWIVSDIALPYSPVRVRPRLYRPNSLFFYSQPTEGQFALVHGFDGAGPGTIRVAQEISVPLGKSQLTFDYRAAWNLRNALYDRTINVVIEPMGGGLPLDFTTIVRASAGSFNADTGPMSGSIDLSAYAGRTIRVSFDADVPEGNRGPGFFQLDNVALTSGGAPVILSQTRNIAALGQAQPVGLRVSAQGGLPLRYQWYRDGLSLTNETNAVLIVDASTNNAGVYRADVSNSEGSASTAPITLEIVGPMEIGTPYVANGATWIPFSVFSGNGIDYSNDLQTWHYLGGPRFIDDAWSIFDPSGEPHRFYRLRSTTISNAPLAPQGPSADFE